MKVDDIDNVNINEIIDQNQVDKFLRSALLKRHKTILEVLSKRMVKYNFTLEDIKNEIREKRSPFSKSQRDFIFMYKNEFLQDLLNDFYELTNI